MNYELFCPLCGERLLNSFAVRLSSCRSHFYENLTIKTNSLQPTHLYSHVISLYLNLFAFICVNLWLSSYTFSNPHRYFFHSFPRSHALPYSYISGRAVSKPFISRSLLCRRSHKELSVDSLRLIHPTNFSSPFHIQHSMLDVRCSFFSIVHPAQKQISAYGVVSLRLHCFIGTTYFLEYPLTQLFSGQDSEYRDKEDALCWLDNKGGFRLFVS